MTCSFSLGNACLKKAALSPNEKSQPLGLGLMLSVDWWEIGIGFLLGLGCCRVVGLVGLGSEEMGLTREMSISKRRAKTSCITEVKAASIGV